MSEKYVAPFLNFCFKISIDSQNPENPQDKAFLIDLLLKSRSKEIVMVSLIEILNMNIDNIQIQLSFEVCHLIKLAVHCFESIIKLYASEGSQSNYQVLKKLCDFFRIHPPNKLNVSSP